MAKFEITLEVDSGWLSYIQDAWSLAEPDEVFNIIESKEIG